MRRKVIGGVRLWFMGFLRSIERDAITFWLTSAPQSRIFDGLASP